MRSPAFREVNDELVKYVKLRELLSADEPDVQAVLDTLEGETNLHEALAELAKSALEDEAMANGLKDYLASLKERKSRLLNTAQTKRGLIIMAMERAKLDKVKQPEVTVSIVPTQPKLVINDEAKIPAKFFKQPDPVLDEAAIRAALEAKEIVEGASLSNGGVTVTLRAK
jgi:hypothetical protein